MGSHPSKTRKSFTPAKSLDIDKYFSEEDVNEVQAWLEPIIEEDEVSTEKRDEHGNEVEIEGQNCYFDSKIVNQEIVTRIMRSDEQRRE